MNNFNLRSCAIVICTLGLVGFLTTYGKMNINSCNEPVVHFNVSRITKYSYSATYTHKNKSNKCFFVTELPHPPHVIYKHWNHRVGPTYCCATPEGNFALGIFLLVLDGLIVIKFALFVCTIIIHWNLQQHNLADLTPVSEPQLKTIELIDNQNFNIGRDDKNGEVVVIIQP